MMNENMDKDMMELNLDEMGEVTGGKSANEKIKATGSVNVRTGPGLQYPSIGTIEKGDKLVFLGATKKDDRGVRWYKVKYNGKNGWVSSKYSKIV